MLHRLLKIIFPLLLLISITAKAVNTAIEDPKPTKRTALSKSKKTKNNRTKSYRYGFNGKEKDDEVKGAGNQQDYGFRIYDPRLGKFLSVDPLTKKFPELSSYQFASNTPIWAIDMDGLEAFFVHGMKSSKDNWRTKEFQEVEQSLIKLTNNKTINDRFDWSGKGNGVFQKKSDRLNAAEKLANYVLENKVEGEEITLIGVSHGGNVSILAAKILGEKGYKVNVINLNTTSFSGVEGDSENPNGNEGINDMIDIRTNKDIISGLVRGSGFLKGLFTGKRATNTYGGPGQTLTISNDEKSFLNRHATKNVDESQIDNSSLKKLKPVPEENNPPAGKK